MASSAAAAPGALSGLMVGAVAIGGAVGACARAWLGQVSPSPDAAFPWTTLAINVVGCAMLALLPAVGRVRDHPVLAAAVGPGVLGGFTTLSTWSEETHTLMIEGQAGLAAAYVVATLVGCFAAVAAGARLASPRGRVSVENGEGEL